MPAELIKNIELRIGELLGRDVRVVSRETGCFLVLCVTDVSPSRSSRATTSDETTIWASLKVFIKNTWSSGNGTCVLKIDCRMPWVVQPTFLTRVVARRTHFTGLLGTRIGGKGVQPYDRVEIL